MRLRVLLPTHVFLEKEVSKVVAEAENGSFGLLPRHIDYVTSLVPGILSFQTEEDKEEFLAVDGGVLVKRGYDVFVSTRNAVHSTDLEALRQTVRDQFEMLDEREKRARSALARMEASFVERFMEIQETSPS
jgi:F-type H+-transporting ATPase subunit epsilon